MVGNRTLEASWGSSFPGVVLFLFSNKMSPSQFRQKNNKKKSENFGSGNVLDSDETLKPRTIFSLYKCYKTVSGRDVHGLLARSEHLYVSVVRRLKSMMFKACFFWSQFYSPLFSHTFSIFRKHLITGRKMLFFFCASVEIGTWMCYFLQGDGRERDRWPILIEKQTKAQLFYLRNFQHLKVKILKLQDFWKMNAK